MLQILVSPLQTAELLVSRRSRYLLLVRYTARQIFTSVGHLLCPAVGANVRVPGAFTRAWLALGRAAAVSQSPRRRFGDDLFGPVNSPICHRRRLGTACDWGISAVV
jgi:hypothetical protein